MVGTHRRVHLLVDNMSVQRTMDAIFRGKSTLPWAHAYGFWSDIKELAQRLPSGSRCFWIPSHGKKQAEWTPPENYDRARCRRLNDKADLEASKWSLDLHTRLSKKFDHDAKEADGAVASVIRRLMEGEASLLARNGISGGDPSATKPALPKERETPATTATTTTAADNKTATSEGQPRPCPDPATTLDEDELVHAHNADLARDWDDEFGMAEPPDDDDFIFFSGGLDNTENDD